jgi:RHS repeat-associated protein
MVDSQGEATTYEYDALNRETKQVLPNGIAVQHVYDAAGRETRKEERNAAGLLLLSWAFEYDALGNKQRVSELDGSVTTYGYDATSQLTGEQRTGTNPYSILYSYDAAGNRLTKTQNGAVTTSSYNALNQLVRQQAPDGTVTTFSYDLDGNLSQQSQSSGSGTSYTFDDLDQLRVLEVRGVGGALQSRNEFRYDALSRLLISKATVNGTISEKRRLFDGLDVVQERNGSNALIANVARDGNIGGIVAHATVNGDVCFHYDGQGNVVALSDESGTLVARYVYDAFGNLLASSGARAGENPYRFSTKESVGGLVYFGFRFYDSSIGRWISRDPLEEDGGVNLYGFVGNAPINFLDEYGLVKRSLIDRLYRWAYTDDQNASDEVYDAALDAGVDGADCYINCLKRLNTQAISLAGGIATSGIAYGGTPRPLGNLISGRGMKTGRLVKSGVRAVGLRIAAIERARLIRQGEREAAKTVIATGNKWLNAANQFKKASTLGRAAKIGVAGIAIGETAAALYCSRACKPRCES